MLIDLLPTNVIKAFGDGNTSQIIILGVFVGIAALVLGNVCEGVRKGIEELNVLADYVVTCFRVGFIMLDVFHTGCVIGSVDRSKFDDEEPAFN
jgi:Na+/H+-dicarboxylate symporter